MKIAIYPGTFDPITNGHLDVIKRASKLFDKLIIGVALDNNKKTMFSILERINLIENSLAGFDNVEVVEFKGLLMNFAESTNSIAIIRGLRVLSDFEYEFKMAMMNRGINEEISTLFLMPHMKYVHISSSLVKEVSQLGGDISDYVPLNVLTHISKKIDAKK
jgi:pantetheine-phosphate adenylyltransferase